MPEPDCPCRIAGQDTLHIYARKRRVSSGGTDHAAAEVVLDRLATPG